MSGDEQADKQRPEGEPDDGDRRIAFERLRERTDELEMIVSGLTAFALLAVPSRLFDAWVAADGHADGYWEMILLIGFMISSGLCYALAAAFIGHLAIRAYWIGLIGLKATYPKGIRWDAIGTLGPVSRAFYRARLPDLMSAIDRADRMASVVFATATLVALLILWTGLAMALILVLAGLFGWVVGVLDKVVILSLAGVYVVSMLIVTATTMFDAIWIKRHPELAQRPRIRGFIERLLRVYSMILPIRMIMPVQLTLHSNTSGRLFLVGLFSILFVAPMLGITHVVGSRVFSIGGGYVAIDTEAIEHGLASAHYEDQRGDDDRLLRYPMIPSDQVGAAHLRLFIPHLPSRDNPLLRERCPALAEASTGAPGVFTRAACVAALWTVTLDGEPVELDEFLSAERRDLGLRGLQGYLAMAGLAAGRHDLLLIWNAEDSDDRRLRRREYRIPFWLSPGYEMEMTEFSP